MTFFAHAFENEVAVLAPGAGNVATFAVLEAVGVAGETLEFVERGTGRAFLW